MTLREGRLHRSTLRGALTLTLLVTFATPSQAQHAGRAVVDSVARALLAEPDYIGVAAAVGREGKIVLSRGYGTAIRSSSTNVSNETQFRAYSVVKPMTAVLAARLAERGVVDLDAPISRYLDSLPPMARPITVRQLVGHLGGIRHYREGEWLSVSQAQCTRAGQGLAPFMADPLVHPPGEAVKYSSFGYVLLSATLEAAAGVPFPQLLRREIVEPAHMTAMVLDDPTVTLPNRATPHEFWRDSLYDARRANNTCKMGAGGFMASAEDLVRFGLALLDGRLLGEDMQAEVLRPMILPSGETSRFGFGFSFDTTDDGTPYAWTSGGSIGGRAAIVLFPNEGLVAALASSANGRNLVDATVAIASGWRGKQRSKAAG